jgi:hypothetical protein
MKVTYINDTVAEFVRIPDITNHQELAIVGYLLFQGPLDGTSLGGLLDSKRTDVQENIEQFKERERKLEIKKIHEYIRDPRVYVVSRFEDEYDTNVLESERTGNYKIVRDDEVRPLYRDPAYNEHLRVEAQSVYKTEDGDWNERKLQTVATASFQVDEAFDALGRWAGDDVRLVIDPESDDLDGTEITDSVTREMTRVLPDQFLVNGTEVLTPDMVMTSGDGDGGESEQEPPELFQ